MNDNMHIHKSTYNQSYAEKGVLIFIMARDNIKYSGKIKSSMSSSCTLIFRIRDVFLYDKNS